MAKTLIRFAADVATWATCIVITGFLSAAGLIDDPAFALAGGALFIAIRAENKKADA